MCPAMCATGNIPVYHCQNLLPILSAHPLHDPHRDPLWKMLDLCLMPNQSCFLSRCCLLHPLCQLLHRQCLEAVPAEHGAWHSRGACAKVCVACHDHPPPTSSLLLRCQYQLRNCHVCVACIRLRHHLPFLGVLGCCSDAEALVAAAHAAAAAAPPTDAAYLPALVFLGLFLCFVLLLALSHAIRLRWVGL